MRPALSARPPTAPFNINSFVAVFPSLMATSAWGMLKESRGRQRDKKRLLKEKCVIKKTGKLIKRENKKKKSVIIRKYIRERMVLWITIIADNNLVKLLL